MARKNKKSALQIAADVVALEGKNEELNLPSLPVEPTQADFDKASDVIQEKIDAVWPNQELPATDVVPVDATVREAEVFEVTQEDILEATEMLNEITKKELPPLTEAEKQAGEEVKQAFTLTTPTDKQTYTEDVDSKANFVKIDGLDKTETIQVFVGNNVAEAHTLQPTESKPADAKTNSKYLLNGVSASALLRFMGHNGITASPAKKVLQKMGMHPMPAQATIQTQIQRGKAGESILPLGEELEKLVMDTYLEINGAGSKVVIDLPVETPIDESAITGITVTSNTKA